MLSKDEEDKVAKFLEECTVHIEQGYQNSYIFYPVQVQWLAEKLKELNDECSAITEELQKTNQELGRLHEVYGA